MVRNEGAAAGNEALGKAYRNYSLLDKEVKLWLKVRGPFWRKELQPESAPPYFPLVNFPEAIVLEVWVRVNRVMDAPVSDTVLRESWREFQDGRPVQSLELQSSLQIALKGIAQLCRSKLEEQLQPDSAPGLDIAVCPVCGEKTSLSVLTPPNGKRFLHCIMCEHEWPVMRNSCICCGNLEPSKQNYLNAAEFPGVEVVVCDACGQYFKEYDLRTIAVADFMWEDVRTLPLNYAAEQWLAEQAKANGEIQ